VIDIQTQIAYWRDGSNEDFEVAQELVKLGRIRHGLFFAHLALEKMLKAHVCRATQNLAPKTHNLIRLVELSDLRFSRTHQIFLAGFDMYQLEGRYPDSLPEPPSKDKALRDLQIAEEILQWLRKQL
jgi:HEPN domain-containing protein